MPSKSIWIIRAAWVSLGVIILWALLSFFVLKPQNVSLLHLLIWGFLATLNTVLFMTGFITALLEYYRGQHQMMDAALKKVLFRRIFWTLPGLVIALLVLGLLVFLLVSVSQAIFAVH